MTLTTRLCAFGMTTSTRRCMTSTRAVGDLNQQLNLRDDDKRLMRVLRRRCRQRGPARRVTGLDPHKRRRHVTSPSQNLRHLLRLLLLQRRRVLEHGQLHRAGCRRPPASAKRSL